MNPFTVTVLPGNSHDKLRIVYNNNNVNTEEIIAFDGTDPCSVVTKHLEGKGFIATSFWQGNVAMYRKAKPGEVTEYPYILAEDVNTIRKFTNYITQRGHNGEILTREDAPGHLVVYRTKYKVAGSVHVRYVYDTTTKKMTVSTFN